MKSARAEQAIESLIVLVADASSYNRRLTRMMLVNAGVKSIYEVADGVAALDAVRSLNPDVMLLNWDLPGMPGPEVMRIMRSPGVFPRPNVPVIMVSDVGLRSRVLESFRLGAHELLVRPISPKTLQMRLLGLVLHPRPMVQAGPYYIPLPRRQVGEELTAAA